MHDLIQELKSDYEDIFIHTDLVDLRGMATAGHEAQAIRELIEEITTSGSHSRYLNTLVCQIDSLYDFLDAKSIEIVKSQIWDHCPELWIDNLGHSL